jgi:hypothetical protein
VSILLKSLDSQPIQSCACRLCSRQRHHHPYPTIPRRNKSVLQAGNHFAIISPQISHQGLFQRPTRLLPKRTVCQAHPVTTFLMTFQMYHAIKVCFPILAVSTGSCHSSSIRILHGVLIRIEGPCLWSLLDTLVLFRLCSTVWTRQDQPTSSSFRLDEKAVSGRGKSGLACQGLEQMPPWMVHVSDEYKPPPARCCQPCSCFSNLFQIWFCGG